MELVDVGPLDERLGLAYELAADEREADQASARLSDIPVQERKLMKLGLRPDPEDLCPAGRRPAAAGLQEWNSFEGDLARRYLRDVSPIPKRHPTVLGRLLPLRFAEIRDGE